VQLHALSSPRAEGPSPVLPPQLHAKNAVTVAVLQLNAVPCRDTLFLVFVLRLPVVKIVYLRQARNGRLNAHRSVYTRSGTSASPPSKTIKIQPKTRPAPQKATPAEGPARMSIETNQFIALNTIPVRVPPADREYPLIPRPIVYLGGLLITAQIRSKRYHIIFRFAVRA
jgi:hypothetical protein